jgi:putative phosphoribosyl transferase
MEPGQALFADRRDAGRQIAAQLERYGGRADVVVLGIAGGGAPVAVEVATRLGVPLGMVVAATLTAPGPERPPIGALAEDADPYLTPAGLTLAGVSWEHLVGEVERARAEAAARRLAVRNGKSLALPEGATVVLVDDGALTGATAIATVRAVRMHRPARVVLALPVAPRDRVEGLRAAADELIVLARPDRALPVGRAYADFPVVTDGEVREMLAARAPHVTAHKRNARRSPGTVVSEAPRRAFGVTG